MARLIWFDYPNIITVQSGLSLEQRLNGLERCSAALKDGEVLQDLPGEYRVRLYELKYETDDDRMGWKIPLEKLDGDFGFKPSTICHLLAFRDLYPDLQLGKPIWAPGESFVRGGTQSIGIEEIRAAKGGTIKSTERIGPAYGLLSHYNMRDRSKCPYFGLEQLFWIHNKAALYVKQV